MSQVRRRHYAAAIKNPRCWLFVAAEALFVTLTLTSFPFFAATTLVTLSIAALGSWVCIWVYARDAAHEEHHADAARRDAALTEDIRVRWSEPLQQFLNLQKQFEDLNANGHRNPLTDKHAG